jgi:hypothetical protein
LIRGVNWVFLSRSEVLLLLFKSYNLLSIKAVNRLAHHGILSLTLSPRVLLRRANVRARR